MLHESIAIMTGVQVAYKEPGSMERTVDANSSGRRHVKANQEQKTATEATMPHATRNQAGRGCVDASKGAQRTTMLLHRRKANGGRAH